MRPPTKGRVLKERVWCFVEALLTRAEDSPDFEVHWETDKETGRPNFVVKTKRRFLESLAQLKQHELYEVIESLEKLQIWDDRRLKRGKGSEIGWFALKLWSTDVQRNREQFERVWEGSRTAKSKALEATYNKPKDSAEASEDEIDWHNICRTMLKKQKRLTTNELLSADEDMKFELDDIHVPLALVQRTKPDKRSGDVSPEEGSRLLQPTYEEKQRFRHEEFLAQVLQEGKGQSKGRRIAVIGEPGAGKTTLLQSIAFWLFEEKNRNLGLPIWISLADLQGKTLEEYLLQRWLKNALEVPGVTPEQENALVELFKKERVWLLLDGVDEIAGGSVGVGAQGLAPLQMIASQLEGWVDKARVVLSCRLNVWEANINALGDDFETYRLLDFDYPLQVKEFICRWFRKTDADKGERLWAELDKSERQRIQDLVKNPLRLALLCSTWQSSDKGLPSTKAGLYQRFVEVFYTWKKNRFRTTFDQRQELNAALGRLALRAIDSEVSRFRLRHKVVCEVLGDPEQEGSLFGLALQLGWLNKVGLAAESETEEKVYAFYHPTFQEYFAVLAIAHWHDFMKHNPKQGIYRIFEPQWKEVILLWLGRPHEEVAKKQKEEFIKALVEFEDGCGGFYRFRAYFLAASGIAEFRDCSRAKEIVAQIVQWGLGYFDSEEHVTFLDPRVEGARVTLLQTDCSRAINKLIQLLEITENEDVRWLAARSLGKIALGNERAIVALVRILEATEDKDIRRSAAFRLREIGKGNERAIVALVQILGTTKNEDIRRRAAEILEEIGKGNKRGILALVRILETAENEDIRRIAAKSLGEIDPGNERAIAELVRILETTENEDIRRRAAESLGKIGKGNKRGILALVRLLETTENEETRWRVAFILREIGKGNEQVIIALTQILGTNESQDICKSAIYSLEEIGNGNEGVIAALIRILINPENKGIRWSTAMRLGEVGKGNEQAIAELVRILKASKNEDIRWTAAYSLGKIDPGNERAIAELVQILDATENEDTRRSAAYSLGEIDPGNERAIAELVQILETTDNDDIRKTSAEILGKIALGNEQAIVALSGILKTSKNEGIRRRAAESLEQIGKGNERAIAELAQILETTKNECTCLRAACSLDKIGPGNERAIVALVRILETTKNEDICWRAAESLKQISKDNERAIAELAQILETTENEYTRRSVACSLGEIDPGNERVIAALVRILETTENEDIRRSAAHCLREILQNDQMPSVVSALQHCLVEEVYQTNFDLFEKCYDLIWHCAQNLPYPPFYQAWHQQEGVGKTTTPNSQSLNQADLPQSLQSTIINDPKLCQTIHLICIDGSQFIEPDRPAAKIYVEMVKRGCPKCNDGTPKTMAELQIYWDLLEIEFDKRVVLVFYASSTDTTPNEGTTMSCPYSEAFLRDLSKFGREICVITEQRFDHIPLKFFSPSQTIEDVMEWIRAMVMEE